MPPLPKRLTRKPASVPASVDSSQEASLEEGAEQEAKAVALDTETTGLDLRHGARPFLVTVCEPDGRQHVWRWPVDPLTRRVGYSRSDVLEIREIIDAAPRLALQNAKFDAAALAAVGLEEGGWRWPWHKTHDTTLAGHLLRSNTPHNLTDMAVQYLGVDIERYEKATEDAVKSARTYCRFNLTDWLIAKDGVDGMPSAKQTVWKYDLWLPRVVAEHCWHESTARGVYQSLLTDPKTRGSASARASKADAEGWEYRPPEVDVKNHHPWHTVLEDYANTDSAITMALWQVMCRLLHRRGLWRLYQERRKVLPIVYEMESGGVAISGARLTELEEKFSAESTKLEQECVAIAANYRGPCAEVGCAGDGFEPPATCPVCKGSGEAPYKLTMPRAGSNQSLQNLVFGPMALPTVRRSKKTGQPTLDKAALDIYKDVLPANSLQLAFVTALAKKRRFDTALTYMSSYRRFWRWMHGPSDDCPPECCVCGFPCASAVCNQCGADQPLYDWYTLYPSLNPTGTDTLRWSSSNPNEQNISKQEGLNLRYAFGPPPGYEWWSMDAKNIELRLPAYESGEQEMIALFERENDPPYFGSNHLLVSHILHPKEFEECVNDKGQLDGRIFKKKYASTLYQWVKNGNFAVTYGATAESGTADRAYHVKGGQRKVEERFSRIKELNEKCIAFARKHGYVETMPDKTVDPSRGYPLWCTRMDNGDILPTVPLNYHVQGCLAGESRVLTDQGLVPIRDLVGKTVNVWTGFGWAPAVGLNRGPCRRADVTLSSGLVVRCDTRHKLKNEQNRWVPFEQLRPGGYVALPTEVPPLEPSPPANQWFLLGFLIGDGCLNERRRELGFWVGRKKRPLLDAIEVLLNGMGYPSGVWRGVRRGVQPATGTRDEKYGLRLDNNDFSDWLESVGVDLSWRHDTKRVPAAVWTAGPQAWRDFIEGLWLSDGCRAATSGSGRGLNMNNVSLLKEVQVLASAAGYDPHFDPFGHSLRFRWRAFNAKSTRKYPPAALLRQVDSVQFRNYDRVCDHITDRRNFLVAKKGGLVSQYVAERILGTNAARPEAYRYDTVTSVKVLDSVENTYTMSVDHPLHQFVADGVVHPNTAMWWTMKAMIRTHAQLLEWRRTGFNGHLVMQVHDEIVFQFPKGNAHPREDVYQDGPRKGKDKLIRRSNLWRARVLQNIMAQGGDDIGVPTPVGVEYHEHNWAEGITF